MTLRSRLFYAFSGAVLAFGLVFANLRALVELTGIQAEERTILLLSLAVSLVAAVVLLTRRPVLWLTIPVLLTGGAFFLFRGELGEEIYRFLVCLTRFPRAAPLVKAVLRTNVTPGELSDALWFKPPFFWLLLFAAFLCGAFLLLFLGHLRGCLWFSAFDVLIFCASAVFTNQMPSDDTNVLFFGLNGVLMLASLLIERNAKSAGPAVLCLIVPCLLLSFGIRSALPRYERPEFTDRIVSESVELWKEISSRLTARRRARTAGTGEGGGGAAVGNRIDSVQSSAVGAFPWNRYADRIALDEVGPRPSVDDAVMELYTDRSRTIYLRGVSYGVYASESWEQFSPETLAAFAGVIDSPSLLLSDAQPEEEIRIRTAAPAQILWMPYTPTELPPQAVTVGDSYVMLPPRKPNVYSNYNVLLALNASFAPVSWAYYQFVFSEYLAVPPETKEALAPVLGQFDAADPNLVFRVADYVRHSAEYDPDTPAMPDGEDFVPWFLNESDRGYCVHFASSAAVLLRCLGVPARYVTGYMVRTEGSQWNTVTEDDAHAWVEFFDDSLASWRILETTPSMDDPEEEEAETERSYPAAPLPNLTNEPETVERPAQSAPRTEPTPVSRTRRVSLLWLIPAALLLALILWPILRSARRKAVLDRSGPNERAVLLWRLASSLLSASGAEQPDGWKNGEAIALKARFSPHTIEGTELDALTALLKQAKAAVRHDKNLPRRFALRWFYGV